MLLLKLPTAMLQAVCAPEVFQILVAGLIRLTVAGSGFFEH
jgi:hypothetical protein